MKVANAQSYNKNIMFSDWPGEFRDFTLFISTVPYFAFHTFKMICKFQEIVVITGNLMNATT